MVQGEESVSRKRSGGGKILPALCNLLGTVLLIAVIGLCLPLTLPRVMGYEVYDIVSGSMEPEIPTGSGVYVKTVEPSDVQEGDVIAFYDEGAVVVHRVTVNRTSLGEFVTKGDANEVEDLRPIPYDALIGRVQAHVPYLGSFMAIYASTVGKVYLLLVAACGVMFNMVASRMRKNRKERELLERIRATNMGSTMNLDGSGAARANALGEAAPRRTSVGTVLRRALIAVLAVVFVGSGCVVGYVTWQYSISDATYNAAMERYVSPGDTESISLTGRPIAPIQIDFDALQAENPDVVGWIYCEGTVIDYPVVQGDDNDFYLHSDYTREYNINGSIFVDGDNSRGFVDSNTIIYGHHMNSGSMFASLEDWAQPGFYEEHPIVWLLTPTQDYQIVLFAGHHTNAYSSMYDIVKTPGKALDELLATAVAESDFAAQGVELDPNGRYVMLSTCAYVFDNARYALHGKLTLAGSAGGKAL